MSDVSFYARDAADQAALSWLELPADDMQSNEIDIGVLKLIQRCRNIELHLYVDEDAELGLAVSGFECLGAEHKTRDDSKLVNERMIDANSVGGWSDQFRSLREKCEGPPPDRLILRQCHPD